MGQDFRGQTVLLVDDSEKALATLQALYQDLGFEVIGWARNGVEGLERLAARRPDLLSIDIVMPEMNGIEFYRKVIAKYPDQRCLFVSYLVGEKEAAEHFKDIPSHLFVQKPAKIESLSSAINRLGGSQAEVNEDTSHPVPPHAAA